MWDSKRDTERDTTAGTIPKVSHCPVVGEWDSGTARGPAQRQGGARVLPGGPCAGCGAGLFWRPSGGAGAWRCEACEPPPDDLMRDACAVPT